MSVATQGRTHVKHSTTPISVVGGCSGKAKILQLDESRSIRKAKVVNTFYFTVKFEDFPVQAKYDGTDMQSVIHSVRTYLKHVMELPADQVVDFDKPAIDAIWKMYMKSAVNV